MSVKSERHNFDHSQCRSKSGMLRVCDVFDFVRGRKQPRRIGWDGVYARIIERPPQCGAGVIIHVTRPSSCHLDALCTRRRQPYEFYTLAVFTARGKNRHLA
jgi:hypothetical protein